MSDERIGAKSEDNRPEQRPSNTVELEDGRQCWRFWVPAYVLEQFAEVIGQRGVALYCSLAWWLCRRAPHRRPKLAEIGQRAGCSRATVWRGLKELEAVGLVEIVPQVGPTGRRPHKIRLVHPEGVSEDDDDSGTRSAGGVNLSAPSVSTQDLNVCVNGTDTHTRDPASPENPLVVSDAEKFSENWMAALGPGARGWRADQRKESAAVAGALLERGWTLEELLGGIADPNRDTWEWPRVFAARYTASALKAVRGSAKAAEERQNRATAAERAREERATAAQTAAQYDDLPLGERERWEREAVQLRPHTAQHPSIVRLLAIDLFAGSAAGQLGSAADAAELPTGNGRAIGQ